LGLGVLELWWPVDTAVESGAGLSRIQRAVTGNPAHSTRPGKRGSTQNRGDVPAALRGRVPPLGVSAPTGRCVSTCRRLKKVQMRGGARRQPARRSRVRGVRGHVWAPQTKVPQSDYLTRYVARLPRAPYLRRWAFFSLLRRGTGRGRRG